MQKNIPGKINNENVPSLNICGKSFKEDEYRVEAQTLFMPEFLAGTQELFDVLDMIEGCMTER
ncbi:MAG: hypothetical protein WDO19_03240 [Bacteroidota bacterium]